MELRILGPLEVLVGGVALDLGAGRGGELLTALALRAREPVPADVLVQALWGDDAPSSARRALQVRVSRLRARLGPAADRLVTAPTGYRLDIAPDEIDATRFEALCTRARGEESAAASATLADALALWRGPALVDVRYETFAQPEIARLEELRWAAIEDRLEAELALGRHATAVAELERAAAGAPARERLIELRMRALYGAGRHVEALEVYGDARRRLDEELGLEPGPALRRLEQAILEHDPSLAAGPTPARTAPSAPPTATVGRERDLEAVAQALEASRLVTLTGPGGVGKTRLAVETARALADRHPGRVYVAWLARVADPAGVAAALASAVDVVAQPGERVEDALARRLGGPAALLVADNLEHVLDAAPLLAELVAACPALRVLATSREPLSLRGERCLPVAPLAVPDAITLFMDRARDRRPDFGLTDANSAAVAELCERLDGLPLALELAAGRVGLLGPEQLVARLGDALDVLEGGPRDAPARQRTIRATLEWSVALLDEPERRAFLALAAFTGGAELDAAEEVTGEPLAVLEALVAKSLVAERDGRLFLLEVVRQFAAAELDDDAVRERHAARYLATAEELAAEIDVRGEGPALRRFERELGNFRAALDWFLARRDGERSLRMACALAPYSSSRSGHRDSVRALDAALAVGEAASDRARGRALALRAHLSWWVPEQKRRDAEEALALAESCGDLKGQCVALDELATQATLRADFATGAALARRQRAAAEALGEPYEIGMAVKRQAFAEPGLREARAFADEATRLLRGTGSVLRIAQLHMGVVMVALSEEEYEAADELAAEGLRAADEAGNTATRMFAHGNAGLAALCLGHMDVAERRFRQQLSLCRRERLYTDDGEAIFGLAAISASAGDGARAATLMGACEEPLRRMSNDADQPIYDRIAERFVAPARAAFGEAAWASAAAGGAALTLDERIDLALDHPGYHLIS